MPIFENCVYDETGGIICSYRGYPFHCTETDTPDQWAQLRDLLATGEISVSQYVAPPAPTAAQLLAAAQAAQIYAVISAYQAAIYQSVSYASAGGVTKTFQADSSSQNYLFLATQGYFLAGAAPAGFYWVSEDNTQVPFALSDLKGLYAAMLAQGWAAFQKLQTLKSAINSATTVSEVKSVTWGGS